MTTLIGKISWFGGPHDSMAGDTTATGAPTSTPGIAVYNQHTKGGWWLVTMPNGRRAVVRQTDIGPAPWTGRKLDFTYSLLPYLGYTEQNFPTGGVARATYLGKSIPARLRSANGVTIIDSAAAAAALGAGARDTTATSSTSSGGGGGLSGDSFGADLFRGLLYGTLAATGIGLSWWGVKTMFGPPKKVPA